jgi:VWFA-related protein
MKHRLQASRVSLVLCLVTGAAAVSGTLPLLRAQDAASGDTVLRSETRIVLVDAVAADKKGRFARDLTQKDFRLWEDGKEQKITSFSLESSGLSPERSSKHYIAIFFDTTMAGQVAPRQQAMHFVDGFASPDRYMAVISYNLDGGARITQDFTTAAALLKKALGVMPGSSNPATGAVSQTYAARGGRGAPAATANTTADVIGYRDMLASLRSIADSLATIRGRKALIIFSGRAGTDVDISREVTATIDACNRANVAVYLVDGRGLIGTLRSPGARGALAALQRAAENLSTLLVSNSVNTESLSFQRGGVQMGGAGASAGANSSNLDSVIPGASAATTQNVMRTLADGTGGLVLTTSNDIVGVLGNIAREQDEYYLLGYTPTVDAAEGTCHELRVKVSKGDLDVRARKGYCTSKQADPLSQKPAGKDLETQASGGAAGNRSAKIEVPWFYSAPNVARVTLAMDVVPAAMKLQKEKNKLHGEFDLAGVAYRSDGTVAARFSDEVKLDFDTQFQADAFLKAPYHYVNQFKIAPGRYTVRVAFTSGASEPVGTGKAEAPLAIEPWNGQTPSMSGLALSHETRAAADLASSLDAALLEGPRPLIAKGNEIVPTGTSQFHKGERGFVYFEVYDPRLGAISASQAETQLPNATVRIRVIERATSREKDDSGPIPAAPFMRVGSPVVPIALALPTADLPAGVYTAEVSVVTGTDAPVVRTTDFDVN